MTVFDEKLAPALWFDRLNAFPAVIPGSFGPITGSGMAELAISAIENLFQRYVGQPICQARFSRPSMRRWLPSHAPASCQARS